uniref:Translation initiation factor eIF2B subunit delta n=1 Tax=Heliothis virescens TaxID=7102 RepID=A0A2A4J0R6_HELVI
MSSNENKSREEVMAARQAKKQAKQKAKVKDPVKTDTKEQTSAQTAQNADVKDTTPTVNKAKVEQGHSKVEPKVTSPKGKDEVDKAIRLDTSITDTGDKSKEQIKAERAAKKAAKQAKKKGAAEGGDGPTDKPAVKDVPKPTNKDSTVKDIPKQDKDTNVKVLPKPVDKETTVKEVSKPVNEDMTVKDVVETLRDIAIVAKEMKDVTNKVIDLSGKKAEESNKSKSELKAERRAKQEAQRAAKQAALEKAAATKPKVEDKATPEKENAKPKEEKASKPKASDKPKVKPANRVNWFQHLYKEHDKESLKSIAINSNLHPAIIKLGVQLASRVVSGSNARCVALLDALKKMVRDYTLPAKTEFARGLESHLATSLDFLWAMRPPSASQTNAVKFFRYHLTQLPNNVDEFDAEESNKSKSELKAERRAKQEAQRAAKQAALEKAAATKPKVEDKATPEKENAKPKEEKASKPKASDKPKVKPANRVNWFQHLYKEHDKESLKSIAINSNLHPAIIKLGVQLASRVVSGSNARCVALLDALKKMVRDYTLPAKTEFARGLESHLATSLDFLWAMRPPSASQTNAVKFFRYHLTQLPNNVDEFDAKKTLQEEIDRYIREQIDMAGEAISIAVRNKISDGDNILTYGCSSLIERILRDAWAAGLKFRTVVVGNRVQTSATQMLRRLVAHGLPCTYVDITALGFVMNKINKVILGAGALLVNGSVLGAAGTAQVALAAREQNVPVLVACETHKFSERVQTDAFVYNEIGDPDDLIDKSDENSPLKDWRSNPNLTPLNLTYDVTPPSLVTAVVTELAILPCTSAPVVLRFKLSEYGV